MRSFEKGTKMKGKPRRPCARVVAGVDAVIGLADDAARAGEVGSGHAGRFLTG